MTRESCRTDNATADHSRTLSGGLRTESQHAARQAHRTVRNPQRFRDHHLSAGCFGFRFVAFCKTSVSASSFSPITPPIHTIQQMTENSRTFVVARSPALSSALNPTATIRDRPSAMNAIAGIILRPSNLKCVAESSKVIRDAPPFETLPHRRQCRTEPQRTAGGWGSFRWPPVPRGLFIAIFLRPTGRIIRVVVVALTGSAGLTGSSSTPLLRSICADSQP